MEMPRFLFIFIGLLYGLSVSYSCYSQEYADALQHIVNETLEATSEEGEEELEELLDNVLNLNSLTVEDIDRFFFLTDFEKQSLWYYISHHRPLLSIYELQYVLGLPKEKAQLLSQFCYVAPVVRQRSVQELIEKGKHTIAFTTTSPNISTNDYKEMYHYAGSPMKEVIRYRFQSFNSLYWGFTIKKDMGEALTFRKGFDSQSVYVQLKNRGVFSNIVLGDYRVSIGQGLTLAQGGSFGSALEQTGGTQSQVLSKHSSTSEYLFSRGVGTTLSLGKVKLTPFVSKRMLDGKISQDSLFPFSITKTGYHRTTNELSNKRKINYVLCGLHSQFEVGRWRIGAAVLQHNFSKDSVRSVIRNASLFYSYFKQHIHLYGECAVDKNFRVATIHGLQYSLFEEVQLSQTVRYYSSEYQSFMASSSGRQSAVRNEMGATSAIRFLVNAKTTLYVSNDMFTFPFATTAVDVPTKGDVFKLKLQYKEFSGKTAYYQYSQTMQTGKQDDGFGMGKKQSHKFYMALPINKNVIVKSAIQCSKISDEFGYLCYADAVWKLKPQLSLSVRFAQFDATYDCRQYAWEDDVLYVFSSSQYMYAGNSWYVVAKWKKNNLQLQGKVSQARYSNKYDLPESYDLYENERKMRFSLLIQWSLN